MRAAGVFMNRTGNPPPSDANAPKAHTPPTVTPDLIGGPWAGD